MGKQWFKSESNLPNMLTGFPRKFCVKKEKMQSISDAHKVMVHHRRWMDELILSHTGEYRLSAREEDFGNWLLCDGRSFDRATYPRLFSIIGTKFGASNSTSFKIPDFRGRVLGQPGQGSGLTSRDMGDSVGEEAHTLTTNELPSHTHTGTTTTNGTHTHGVTDPGHTHTQTTINDDFNNSGSSPPGFAADGSGTRTWSNINSSTTGVTINADGSHSHTFTTDASGLGEAHNNMQPTLFGINVFIFAK